MKILILADPLSIHTLRWANSLNKRGIEIVVFGLTSYNPSDYCNTIKVYSHITSAKTISKGNGSIYKITYLKSLSKLKKIISEFNPDVLHSHYASSYGLLGALTNFHPFIISVWGADVFNFPKQSLLHKKIFNYSLSKADKILSTSKMMVKEIKKYSSNSVEVIPFGVDLEIFKPQKIKSLFDENDIVLGTIKSLEDKYGIDFLIKSFKKLKEKFPDHPLKLLIVGGGSQEKKLKELVQVLKISADVVFTGLVNHKETPRYHNMLDIALFLSIEKSESFGVSVIEASACEKPVIVSNIGGLPEVVENNVTGIVVEPKNIEQISQAIEKLIFNKELRKQLGKNGRERVKKLYDWNNNLNQMEEVYKKISPNFINNLNSVNAR
ncbi:MAG: glycosyltransferase [Ignavibacteriaceae bacterium]